MKLYLILDTDTRIMTFHIITIFPDIFTSYFNESIINRAQKNKIIKIKIHNLRRWATDKHKTIDDAPYGGGAGMIMKVEPICKTLKHITKSKAPLIRGEGGGKKIPNSKFQIPKSKIILFSARGKKWNQKLAKKYSKLDNIILICGRYEGVDERVKKFIDEEISIGDYVLTGGEIGAMAIVDSIARLLPGVLGNPESLNHESHSTPGLLEYPQYTRPEVFYHITRNVEHKTKAPLTKGVGGFAPLISMPRALMREEGRGVKKIPNSKFQNPKSNPLPVPKILLSGNHKKIEEWRKKKMKTIKK